MERTFSDVPFAQQFAVSVVDHVRFGTPIPVGKELLLVIDNPNGASFKGEFVMLNNSGLSFYRRPNGNKRTAIPFELSPHEKETIVRIPLSAAPEKEYGFATQLVLPFPPSLRDVGREKAVYPWLLDRRMFIVDDFSKHDTAKLNATWFLHTDGDKNVGSEQKMEIDGGRAKITYRFDEGWKFLRFFPRSDEMRKIEGKPKAMALLLDGEGIGGYVNLRFADSKGQTFQVSGGPVREKKTYYFEFPLDGTKASHWGGPNDGTVHYPIRFDSVIIDGTRKACGPLSVSISSPVLIYE